MCEFGHRCDVDQGLHWVGRRLEEDRRRRDRQRFLPLLEVLAIHEDGFDAPARQDFIADHKAGSKEAASGDKAVARLQ